MSALNRLMKRLGQVMDSALFGKCPVCGRYIGTHQALDAVKTACKHKGCPARPEQPKRKRKRKRTANEGVEDGSST